MKLKDWLKKKQMTQAAFAKLVGSHQVNVCRWANGDVVPSIPSLEKISKVTAGAVGLKDWQKPTPGEYPTKSKSAWCPTVLKGGKHAAKI